MPRQSHYLQLQWQFQGAKNLSRQRALLQACATSIVCMGILYWASKMNLQSISSTCRERSSNERTFLSSLLKDLHLDSTNGVEKLLSTAGKDRRVVDIGLLTGVETVLAAQNGFKVLGIDPVKKYIQGVAGQLATLQIDYAIYKPEEPRENLPLCLTKRVCLVNAALGNSSFVIS